MINTEDAQIGPNILTLTAEEDENRRREKGRAFRDRTNRRNNRKVEGNGDDKKSKVMEQVENDGQDEF